MAKPIVDGIEKELEGRAQVIRLDVRSTLGRTVAARYGITGLPTTLVFDRQGMVVLRVGGPPNRDQLLEAVRAVEG